MSIIPSRRLLLTSPLPPISAPSPGLSLNHTTTTIPSNSSLKISSSTSSANFDQGSGYSSNFNGPYMGVILVVLLVTFFLMAFFSVYIRRFAFSLGSDSAGDGIPDWALAERMRGGLDRTLIDRLPIVVYHCVEEGKKQAIKGDSQEASKAECDVAPTTTKMKGASKDAAGTTVHAWRQRPDCVVCLTDFEEDENVRLLPKCEHCFHPECIDMWLFSHTTCPLCRRSLLPVPTAAAAESLQTAPPPSPSPSASAVTGLDAPISLGARPNNDVCIDVQEGTSHNTTQQGGSMGNSMQGSAPS